MRFFSAAPACALFIFSVNLQAQVVSSGAGGKKMVAPFTLMPLPMPQMSIMSGGSLGLSTSPPKEIAPSPAADDSPFEKDDSTSTIIDSSTDGMTTNATSSTCPFANQPMKLTLDGQDIYKEVGKQNINLKIRGEAKCAVEEAQKLALRRLQKKCRDCQEFTIVGTKSAQTFGNDCLRNVKIASSVCDYIGNQQHGDPAIIARRSGELLSDCGFTRFTGDPNSLPPEQLEGMVAIHQHYGKVGTEGYEDGHIELLYRSSPSGPIHGISDADEIFSYTPGVTYWIKTKLVSAKKCGGVAIGPH